LEKIGFPGLAIPLEKGATDPTAQSRAWSWRCKWKMENGKWKMETDMDMDMNMDMNMDMDMDMDMEISRDRTVAARMQCRYRLRWNAALQSTAVIGKDSAGPWQADE
jgi:hypothetical protein